MAKLTFYRQARADGGVRTGLKLDDATVLSSFEEGEADPDPALLWFVDLRCQGASLPDDPEAARDWLCDQAPVIREGFLQCARDHQLGTDPDIYPLIWGKFPSPPEGVEMAIHYAAARHSAARELADVLGNLGVHWEDYLGILEPLHPAAS